jgi:hypothetical protein
MIFGLNWYFVVLLYISFPNLSLFLCKRLQSPHKAMFTRWEWKAHLFLWCNGDQRFYKRIKYFPKWQFFFFWRMTAENSKLWMSWKLCRSLLCAIAKLKIIKIRPVNNYQGFTNGASFTAEKQKEKGASFHFLASCFECACLKPTLFVRLATTSCYPPLFEPSIRLGHAHNDRSPSPFQLLGQSVYHLGTWRRKDSTKAMHLCCPKHILVFLHERKISTSNISPGWIEYSIAIMDLINVLQIRWLDVSANPPSISKPTQLYHSSDASVWNGSSVTELKKPSSPKRT